MHKITIIGAGNVGATIAYSLAIKGIASEIVLIDINKEKAAGEAMDISQGTPFCEAMPVYSGSYADAAGSALVIITSGVARKPGQSRLDLARVNVNITKSIMPEITKYAPDATYIIVSNPVDILTYVFTKYSGIPENRIIGSGTILDTSRLRERLSQIYRVSQSNVHAYVLGEHGDSSFVPWSCGNIANVPLSDIHTLNASLGKPEIAFDPEEVEKYVQKSGGTVISLKGATYYAVAIAVCHICKCLFSGVDTALSVSTMLHGEYGIDDVCISTLNLVGDGRVKGKVHLALADNEVARMQQSAAAMKAIIKELGV